MKFVGLFILANFAFASASYEDDHKKIQSKDCKYCENGEIEPESLVKYYSGIVCPKGKKVEKITIKGKKFACCKPEPIKDCEYCSKGEIKHENLVKYYSGIVCPKGKKVKKITIKGKKFACCQLKPTKGLKKFKV